MKTNLELTKKNLTIFKDYINLLKAVNEELSMNIDEEGISVAGMDSSHVAMIDSKIGAGLFEVFEPSEKVVTVNLAELSKFLDRIGKDEGAKITYNADKARLTILTKKGGRTRQFSLPVLEPLEDEAPKPKILFKSEGRILTKSVDIAIKDADLVSEHMKIQLTEDALLFNAVGDIGSASNEFEKESDELLELKSEEDSSATFTLSYLKDMFANLKDLAEVVTISLSTDMPVKIEATPAIDPNLEIILYLAPVIGV